MHRLKAFLTPSRSATSSTGQFSTAKTSTSLFSKTQPEVDGEECLHDCDTCTVHLPRKWDIDESDDLYGHVKGWDYHLLVATGKNDWVRDVADEAGSLMEKVDQKGLEVYESESSTAPSAETADDSAADAVLTKPSKGKKRRVMLSACDMPTGGTCDGEVDLKGRSLYKDDGRTRCVVLPSWTFIEGVSRQHVEWLMDDVIGGSTSNVNPLRSGEIKQATAESDVRAVNATADERVPDPSSLSLTSPEPASTIPASITPSPPVGVTVSALPHRALILLCSHKTRDARCGQSAPLLRKEFERHLRPLGLYRDLHDFRPGGVGIYFINHVGGHKYSANVMIYRREGTFTQQSIDANGPVPALSTNNNGVSAVDTLKQEAVQGIWLARVRPEDCENIVRYTVLKGKVVKPERQLRGGFDRSSGLTSW